MIEMDVNGSNVTLVPVVKGLVEEGRRIAEIVNSSNHECIGLSISIEEIEGLRNLDPASEYEMNNVEIAYAKLLSDFGEVQVPPPCYHQAIVAADRKGVPTEALDMNDVEYTDAYCELIKVRDMFRESIISKRILKTRFDVTTVEDFIVDWDSRINSPKGFRLLEKRREEYIAKRIRELSQSCGKTLAIVDLERSEGVRKILQNL